MTIQYVFYTNFNEEQASQIKKLGQNVKVGYDKIEIEKGELYNKIEPLLEQWGYLRDRFVGTNYSKQEINEADLLEFNGIMPIGYPQPEDDWKIFTYDQLKICNKCSVGKVQKEPFRIKKIPDIKKKKMVSLEWVYEEIFISEEIYFELFKPLNIDFWPVLLHKKETVVPGIVQLKIPTSESSLDLRNQRYELCDQCGQRKYLNQIEGLFPSFTEPQNINFSFFKSKEYYGSGYAANRWIFATQHFRKELIKAGIKGKYAPVAKSK